MRRAHWQRRAKGFPSLNAIDGVSAPGPAAAAGNDGAGEAVKGEAHDALGALRRWLAHYDGTAEQRPWLGCYQVRMRVRTVINARMQPTCTRWSFGRPG